MPRVGQNGELFSIVDELPDFDPLRRFKYDHLPEDLQLVSKPFHDLAQGTIDKIGLDPYLDEFLVKLWEAKNLVVLMVARPN